MNSNFICHRSRCVTMKRKIYLATLKLPQVPKLMILAQDGVQTSKGKTMEQTGIVNTKAGFIHIELVSWKVCRHILFLTLLFGCPLLAQCGPQPMTEVTQRLDSSAEYYRMSPGRSPSRSDGLLRKLTRQRSTSPPSRGQLSGGSESPKTLRRQETCPNIDSFLDKKNWKKTTQKAIDFVKKSALKGSIILGTGLGGMSSRRPTRGLLRGNSASTNGRNGGWSRSWSGSANTPPGSLNFHFENLDVHNEYRAKHGVPPLRLNWEMSEISQRWAEYLASLGPIDNVHHSDRNTFRKGYGENIHASTGYIETGRTAVDAWYDEIKDYDFKKGTSINGNKIGHLTQLLWKDSKELGVGYAFNVDGDIFVVCHYNPTGNYMGQNTFNVPPIGGFS